MSHAKYSTICIAGGSGFVGQALLKRLQSEKDAPRIVCLSRRPSASSQAGAVQWVKGDLLDLNSLGQWIEPGALVVNLAYLPDASPEQNLKAVSHLLMACKTRGAARLIHVSTAVVTGDRGPTWVDEATPCQPGSVYEKTKLAIEDLIRKEWPGESAILRPTAVFGEGGKNLLKLTSELLSEGALKRYLKSSLLRSRSLNLVYVENVVEAILHLAHLRGPVRGECFIVSQDSEAANNYQSVASRLSMLLDSKSLTFRPIPVPRGVLQLALKAMRRPNSDPARRYSSAKLEASGFRPSYTLDEGLTRFAHWYKTRVKSVQS